MFERADTTLTANRHWPSGSIEPWTGLVATRAIVELDSIVDRQSNLERAVECLVAIASTFVVVASRVLVDPR